MVLIGTPSFSSREKTVELREGVEIEADNIFAKEAEGFTKLLPSLLSALTIVLCMYCLSQVMKTISAGYTYATFAGLCIIATTIIGILRFNQLPNFYAFIGLISVSYTHLTLPTILLV